LKAKQGEKTRHAFSACVLEPGILAVALLEETVLQRDRALLIDCRGIPVLGFRKLAKSGVLAKPEAGGQFPGRVGLPYRVSVVRLEG
jgi:hypothetical protein